MRAVRIHRYSAFEDLELEQDVPRPELLPRQVRIAVKAAPLSIALHLMAKGDYQRRPPLPYVPGGEVSGVVTEIAEGVDRLKVGDRVAGIIDWGAMAEEAVGYDATLYPIPDGMPFPEAASLSPSYATSMAALTWRHQLDVQPGEWLLVHGAAGGVGLAAVEIGKALGAKVIAVVGSQEKADFIAAHGADHTVIHTEANFRERVMDLTGGRGADAVFETVGGDSFMQSLRCMAPGSRICVIGFAGGTVPQIPANHLLVKNITVCGLFLGYYCGWGREDVRYDHRDRLAADVERLTAWWREGKLSLHTSHVLPLAEFQEAMRIVTSREAMGRVVVVP
ncbi:MAG: NADPH:quinone oxidoreductase family protein [Minwuia sp.]|uniref:NADPH:quinone oxidoreductase family protein n=1 Tax=Minwuia sp. TaxID=2493630 RepID=UPI003A8C7F44